mgnify:CR=1 FL=1
MNNEQGTALIKFSEAEIECLSNSLYMTTSLKVPTQINGEWKTPYKMLLKQIEGINYQLKEKKRDYINDKKYEAPRNCEVCDD